MKRFLERLLFSLTRGETEEVRRYMDGLNRTGRYEVSDMVRSGIAKHFAAGYCDDGQTKRVIASVWREKQYLIDPHTAVAFDVLEQYRRNSGDQTPAIVASTASPFKFCDSVLTALGVSDLAAGPEIMEQMARITDCPVPAPLAALKDKPIRFNQWTEKEHMVDKVLEMLG